MAFRADLITYEAMRVAAITGVSQDLQRDWRRRNLLPSLPGGKRAVFNFKDLAMVAAVRALTDAGIPQRCLRQIAESLAIGIANRFVVQPAAYLNAVRATPDQIVEAVRSLIAEPEGAARFFVVAHARPEPRGFFTNDLGELVDAPGWTGLSPTAERIAPPLPGLTIIDTVAIARWLAEQAGIIGMVYDEADREQLQSGKMRALDPSKSLIRQARQAAKAAGVPLYSSEGLALVRPLIEAHEAASRAKGEKK